MTDPHRVSLARLVPLALLCVSACGGRGTPDALLSAAPEDRSVGVPKGLAIAAMVLGIAAIPLMCLGPLSWLSLPCAIVAIILGFIAKGRANRGEAASFSSPPFVTTHLFIHTSLMVYVSGKFSILSSNQR